MAASSDRIMEMAAQGAEAVYDRVFLTKYSQRHVAENARRIAFAVLHRQLSKLAEELTGEPYSKEQTEEALNLYIAALKHREKESMLAGLKAATESHARAVAQAQQK